MNDRELMHKILSLKGIKPKQEWVALTKTQILGEEMGKEKISVIGVLKIFSFQYRTAFAVFVLLGLVSGTLILAQGSLPGDFLYPVKKASEKGAAIFVKQNQNPTANLQLAERRLEELNEVSQKNLVQNLPSAFKEYKNAKIEAKKEVSAFVKKNPGQAQKIVKQITPQIKEIDNKEKQVFGALGVEPEVLNQDAEAQNSDAITVEALIKNAEKATLTDEQKNDLEKVKEYFASEKYEEALEFYLNCSLNK